MGASGRALAITLGCAARYLVATLAPATDPASNCHESRWRGVSRNIEGKDQHGQRSVCWQLRVAGLHQSWISHETRYFAQHSAITLIDQSLLGEKVKNWKRRWFGLTNTQLFYFKSEKDVRPFVSLFEFCLSCWISLARRRESLRCSKQKTCSKLQTI